MSLLITGGTGLLRRALVLSGEGVGHAVRVLSRRPRPETSRVEYAFRDVPRSSRRPRAPLPPPPPSGFKFQTVDESEVAARLIECVAQGLRGRVADFGGPDVPPLEEIPTAWTEAGGIMKTVVRLPVPGAAAAAFRTGANTAPGGGGPAPSAGASGSRKTPGKLQRLPGRGSRTSRTTRGGKLTVKRNYLHSNVTAFQLSSYRSPASPHGSRLIYVLAEVVLQTTCRPQLVALISSV